MEAPIFDLARVEERQARAEALRPDAEKLRDYANRLHLVVVPTVESDEAATLLIGVLTALRDACNRLASLRGQE